MRKRRYMVTSNFVCPECGMIMPLPRNHGNRRESGHIKDLYCPRCKETRKFTEIARKNAYTTLDGKVIYS